MDEKHHIECMDGDSNTDGTDEKHHTDSVDGVAILTVWTGDSNTNGLAINLNNKIRLKECAGNIGPA